MKINTALMPESFDCEELRGTEIVEHLDVGEIDIDDIDIHSFKPELHELDFEVQGNRTPVGVSCPELLEQVRDAKAVVLNATVAEFLVRNQNCIPEEWKRFPILFLGTIWQKDGQLHAIKLYHHRPTRSLFARPLILDMIADASKTKWYCEVISLESSVFITEFMKIATLKK